MPKGSSGKDNSEKPRQPAPPAPPPPPIERPDLFEVKERGKKLLTNKTMPKVGDFTFSDVNLLIDRAEQSGSLKEAQRALKIAEHNEARVKRLYSDVGSALNQNLTQTEWTRLHNTYVRLQREMFNDEHRNAVRRARRIERLFQEAASELINRRLH